MPILQKTSCTGRESLAHSLYQEIFGISELPVLDIDTSELERYARTAIDAGLTVPGMQKKLSLNLDLTQGSERLTHIGYPPGFIVKLQTEEYAHLPELEDATMHMADAALIQTVPHALIPLHDGSLAYISKRIDRVITKQGMHKLPMEDFCQLSSRLTEDTYKGSYEQCGKLINTYSSKTCWTSLTSGICWCSALLPGTPICI